MYHSWLDRWDERRTRRRDDVKKVTELVLDSDLAFSANENVRSIGAFCDLAEQTVLDSDRFFCLADTIPEVNWENGSLSFLSSISTGIAENDSVHAKVTQTGSSDHAVIIFHHWNASTRNAPLARFFAGRGLAVVEIALPYHLERTRPGSSYADHMLSANLGRTIQSVRQAVVDGRELIRILQRAGYRKFSVLGISLGSWVAGLVAAHDPAVEKASLLLTAGSLADMVWTGSATRHIRAGLEGRIEPFELRRAWAPLSLDSYLEKLSRPKLDLQIVFAERDKAVLPALSEKLVQQIQDAGATPSVKQLNCGHYSLTLPPYVICVGMGVSRFLNS